MNKITIYFPYYNQPQELKNQLDRISNYSKNIRNKISIFIVDDGSQKTVLSIIEKKHLDKLDIILWRINIDIKWNMAEANNLAFREIKTNYVIRTDIDHFFDENNLTNLLNKNLDFDKNYYKFNRITTTNKHKYPHQNTYIISKKNYWKVKGYNESFSGNYGHDDLMFMKQLNKFISPILLKDIYIKVNLNFRTKGLNRDTSINLKNL